MSGPCCGTVPIHGSAASSSTGSPPWVPTPVQLSPNSTAYTTLAHKGLSTQRMDAILFHPETSIRRALILALGAYQVDGPASTECEPLIGKLLELYKSDPDAGIHGAAEWTLRQWKNEPKLKEIDDELSKSRIAASAVGS